MLLFPWRPTLKMNDQAKGASYFYNNIVLLALALRGRGQKELFCKRFTWSGQIGYMQQGRRKKKDSDSESVSSDAGSNSSDEDRPMKVSKDGDFSGIQRMRRRYERHPRRVWRSFHRRALKKLRVRNERQMWSYTDLMENCSRFGKMTGLLRCHAILPERSAWTTRQLSLHWASVRR